MRTDAWTGGDIDIVPTFYLIHQFLQAKRQVQVVGRHDAGQMVDRGMRRGCRGCGRDDVILNAVECTECFSVFSLFSFCS